MHDGVAKAGDYTAAMRATPVLSRRRVIFAALGSSATWLPVARALAHDAEEVALGSLVDAEVAFSDMAQKRGVRAAFLANFAPDGIVFEPTPVRLHEAWAARPEPADPKAVKLEWHPAQAGVARSLDMGYTTGPFALSNAARPGVVRHGVFFSVWHREGSDAWQVSVDAGIVTPDEVDFVALGAAPRPHFAGARAIRAQRKRLLDLEMQPIAAAKSEHGGVRYLSLLADDVRLHRDGMTPLVGRDRVAAYVGERINRLEWAPIEVRMARSTDLAVTYGRARETVRDGGARAASYTHLWLRERDGRWRLAYDIATGPGSRE